MCLQDICNLWPKKAPFWVHIDGIWESEELNVKNGKGGSFLIADPPKLTKKQDLLKEGLDSIHQTVILHLNILYRKWHNE